MEIKRLAERHTAPCEDTTALVPAHPARSMHADGRKQHVSHFKSKARGWLYLEAGPRTGFIFRLIRTCLCTFYGHTIDDSKQTEINMRFLLY